MILRQQRERLRQKDQLRNSSQLFSLNQLLNGPCLKFRWPSSIQTKMPQRLSLKKRRQRRTCLYMITIMNIRL